MDKSEPSQFPSSLRSLILATPTITQSPLLFPHAHLSWRPCTWSLDHWSNLIFKDKKLQIRVGKRVWDNPQPQWETECGRGEMTFKELLEWGEGRYHFLDEGGDSPDDVWVYYDYKYLREVVNSEMKSKFSWGAVGFPERNSDHSTLWIGSKGSQTPCHFDTYSVNLVCQVYGKKTWLLIHPHSTSNLHPTRIPYEESSVYSRINFSSLQGILSYQEELKKCEIFKVMLEPGDVMFVPQGWWHYCEAEEFSISVNTWVEMPGDHSKRVEEAIMKVIVGMFVNTLDVDDEGMRLLNPNESDLAELTPSDLDELLASSTSAYMEEEGQMDDEENLKKPRLTPPESFSYFCSQYKSQVESLTPISFPDLLKWRQGNIKKSEVKEKETTHTPSKSSSYLPHLLNAIGHPNVLQMIKEQFVKNVRTDMK